MNMKFLDLQVIFSHQGKVDGIVGSCKIDELLKSVTAGFKSSLKNAKGVFIEFEKHDYLPSAITSSILKELHALINKNAVVVFTTTQNNDLDSQIVNFKIIVTGLEYNSGEITEILGEGLIELIDMVNSKDLK